MLEVFDYQGQQVRTDYKDEAVWFVAADVCRVLDIINPTMTVGRLDDDEKGSSADKVHPEIEGRIAHEHIDEYQVKEQLAVLLDFLPHTFVPGISKKQNADTRKTNTGEIHRSKIITEPLLDERVYDGP